MQVCKFYVFSPTFRLLFILTHDFSRTFLSMRRPGRTADACTYASVNDVGWNAFATTPSTVMFSILLSKNFKILKQYEVAISIFHSHLSKMNFHYELPFSSLISSIDSSVNRRDIIILIFWIFAEMCVKGLFMCMRMLASRNFKHWLTYDMTDNWLTIVYWTINYSVFIYSE